MKKDDTTHLFNFGWIVRKMTIEFQLNSIGLIPPMNNISANSKFCIKKRVRKFLSPNERPSFK